jgi:transposase
VSASGDTLLPTVSSSALAVAPPPPRILGLDHRAWRRGRCYGTINRDLEQRRLIDLLPDRDAGTLASWLKRRGGEVALCTSVSRTRQPASVPS